jgi:hypothetical protein
MVYQIQKFKAEMSQYQSILEKRQKALGDIQTKLNDIDSSFRHLFHENEMKIDYETKTTKTEVSFHSVSVINFLNFVSRFRWTRNCRKSIII